MKLRLLYIALTTTLLIINHTARAQYVQVDNSYTAQQLVTALMQNSCAQVSNVSLSGAPGVNVSTGYFNAGSSSFPFTGGVVLTSGFASSVPGPNGSSALSEGSSAWDGDNDLEQALNIQQTFNATILEFDFTPITTNISFDYIFASEEYLQNPPTADWCNYSDGFAFLIRKAGSTEAYQNLAVIPNTSIPVKVTSVRGGSTCPSANEEYFAGYNATESPINFNGQTVILTATANVEAGATYHIKLVIADQGDNQYDSAIFLGEGSFKSTKDLGENRLLSTNNPLCAGESFVLDGTLAMASSYQWYKDGVAITGAIAAQYTVTEAGVYKVESELLPGCYSEGEITLEYAPVSNDATVSYYQCDNDTNGLTAYYLDQVAGFVAQGHTGYNVQSFHHTKPDAENNVNPITTAGTDTPYYNTTAGEIVYTRAENVYGCIVTVPVALLTSTAADPVWDVTGLCDDADGTDDGIASFDLSEIATDIQAANPAANQIKFYSSYSESLRAAAPLSTSYRNSVPGGQTLYARLDNVAGCYAIIEIPLEVYGFRDALAAEEVIICEGHTLTLDAGSGYATYLWSTANADTTQSVIVEEPGTYSVALETAEGCTGTKTYTVVLSGAATGASYEVNDFRGSSNSVTITPQGPGTYEYSMDGLNYQDSPVFNNLPEGYYSFFIRDTNGCSPVFGKSLYVLDFPIYFTPNSDGFQDRWHIKNLATRPGITITIYDRYGKLITGFGSNSTGWDGTLNGKPLPADDYWFAIRLENGEVVKGHFALVR